MRRRREQGKASEVGMDHVGLTLQKFIFIQRVIHSGWWSEESDKNWHLFSM